jgi:hypothetical protein
MSSQVIDERNFSGWVFEKSSSEGDYGSVRFPDSLFGGNTKGIFSGAVLFYLFHGKILI